MGIHQLSSSEPILCFKVSGTLTRAELGWLQGQALADIKNWGKIGVLAILEDFQDWKKGPGWDDTSFANEHDRSIAKRAQERPSTQVERALRARFQLWIQNRDWSGSSRFNFFTASGRGAGG